MDLLVLDPAVVISAGIAKNCHLFGHIRSEFWRDSLTLTLGCKLASFYHLL